MASWVNKVKTTAHLQNGARLVAMVSVLSTGVLGSMAAQAAGLEDGVRVSLEGLDQSATFVSFDKPGNAPGVISSLGTGVGKANLPKPPQDLSVLLAEVENVLGETEGVPAVPANAVQVQALVVDAQALVAPILGAMGGGTMPNLAGLSLGDLPLNGFGAGGGGAPLALPGLEGLDAALPGDNLGGVLGGALDAPLGGGFPVGDAIGGALGGVTGGLPTVPVVGGLLGQ